MMTLIDEDRLMQPRINLNGMTWGQHVELRINARNKLFDAMVAISDLRPHGRDYLGDDAAYERDLAIHNERFAFLDRLNNELYEEAINIQSGVGA